MGVLPEERLHMTDKPGLRRLLEPEDFSDDCDATGSGILRCLEMLADEAVALRMQRTLDALLSALETCTSEIIEDDAVVALNRPPGTLLH